MHEIFSNFHTTPLFTITVRHSGIVRVHQTFKCRPENKTQKKRIREIFALCHFAEKKKASSIPSSSRVGLLPFFRRCVRCVCLICSIIGMFLQRYKHLPAASYIKQKKTNNTTSQYSVGKCRSKRYTYKRINLSFFSALNLYPMDTFHEHLLNFCFITFYCWFFFSFTFLNWYVVLFEILLNDSNIIEILLMHSHSQTTTLIIVIIISYCFDWASPLNELI